MLLLFFIFFHMLVSHCTCNVCHYYKGGKYSSRDAVYCNCNDCNTSVNHSLPLLTQQIDTMCGYDDGLMNSTRACWGKRACWMHLQLKRWHYTSLDYLASLSKGRSWFKKQLQQVECCDRNFCHSQCAPREPAENIIWWNNHWGIDDMWSMMIHPAMMPLQPDECGLPN